MGKTDDRSDDIEDDEPKGKRASIEDELDTVDVLFDLDEAIEPENGRKSPGMFNLLGKTWQLAAVPYQPAQMPDPNANPAGYMLITIAGFVHRDERDEFSDLLWEAWEAEKIGLDSAQTVQEKLVEAYQNRQQRRVAKKAGRPTGGR